MNRSSPAAADLQIAFQPMIAAKAGQPFAWHAVAMTPTGRSFATVAATLPPEQRPALEASRIDSILHSAVASGLRAQDTLVAVPIGAGAGMAEALLARLFRAALTHDLPIDRLVVAINADERGDFDAAAALAQACSDRGVAIALTSFAAGPVALKLLSRFTPLFVTLDSSLVRNIDVSASRRLIVEGVMRLARSLGVSVVARGAERRGEHQVLSAIGVRHFQLERTTPAGAPPRREARTPSPSHRRLTHHQRASFPLRAAGPRVDLGVVAG